MRLFELVSEKHRAEVISQFKNAGYKQAGTGVDAMVFKKDSTHVAKLIFPQNPANMSESVRVFIEFYNFCKNNPSKHLPEFQELNEVEVDGEVFTQIIMEKLLPIKAGSIEEAMVWILGDSAPMNITWDELYDAIFQFAVWQDYPGPSTADDILMSVQDLSYKQLQEYAELYDLMQVLYKTGQAQKMGWDLHTNNVMRRKNGTLVITDPWVL